MRGCRRQLGRHAVACWMLAAMILAVFAALTPVWAQTNPPQVLVLYSTRRDAQIVVTGERVLPQVLEAGLGYAADYYSEYIEVARFPDPAYQKAVADFLALKYRGRHFDVIVAMDVTLDFVTEHREELFPDTPIVFFSNSSAVQRPPNSTGVVTSLDYSGTVGFALELQPALKHVFVVTGAARADIVTEGKVREQLRRYESRVAITYFAGLPTADLEARLKTLPPQSAVYYVVVDQDGAGVNFHPLQYLKRVTDVSNAPVYSWVDSAMDRGVVGGSMKDQTAQIEAVGRLALRVLGGERADDIPLDERDLAVRQVDWRMLRKWDISDAVPTGTVVRFREPTMWDRYRGYIVGAVVILLAQSALIAGLLVQRSQRRKAEEQVRGSQAEVQRGYDRIRDLAVRLLNAQESERARIARELHDDISQQLALLAIDLEILNSTRTDALVGDAVDRAQNVARSVHDLSHRLHPAKLRLIGLVASLGGLPNDPGLGGMSTSFTHDSVPPTLPPDLTLCLFRIAQEALQNTVKYSAAQNVSIHLAGTATGLVLTVMDDGVGFEVERAWGKGLGLVSMAERVEAIGGSLAIQSQPGAGTRLEVTVPFKADAPSQSVAV